MTDRKGKSGTIEVNVLPAAAQLLGDRLHLACRNPSTHISASAGLRALIAFEEFGGEPPGAALACSMTHSVMRGVLSETMFYLFSRMQRSLAPS